MVKLKIGQNQKLETLKNGKLEKMDKIDKSK